jgi:hypothetical protein
MNEKEQRVLNVTRAPLAQGQKEYLAYMNGQRLTLKESILANCYLCMGYYIDGKKECKVSLCPFYPFMPYNPDKTSFKAESETPLENVVDTETKRSDSGVEA